MCSFYCGIGAADVVTSMGRRSRLFTGAAAEAARLLATSCKLHVQRPDGTWITPIGSDPPTDADFATDNQIRQHILNRLNNP